MPAGSSPLPVPCMGVCVPKTSSLLAPDRIIYHRSETIALICFCLRLFTLPLKSKIRLVAENAILRHQLLVLERQKRGRVRFTNGDRLFFVWLYRRFPSMLDTLRIIQPETLVRWAGIHRTSITPGGVAIGGLYSTYEIATAIAATTKTSSAVCQRLRLSHTAYSHPS
jgi:hypothetical protein